MRTKTCISAAYLLFLPLFFLLSACGASSEPITVLAGKGLQLPVDEIKALFEQKEGVKVTVIYSGSETLLRTLKSTQRGDVFIPGSPGFIKEAGALIASDQFIGWHVPGFAVRADNPRQLRTYEDLLNPGIRIAVGNKDMNAIGRLTDLILKDVSEAISFRNNIVVTSSTVNELHQLVVSREVDAAFIWLDMLHWPGSEVLRRIDIPAEFNKPREIRVATLATSNHPKLASRFAHFVATDGNAIFEKHGFGKQ
jgi:molybdate transport system substrate-binding protein